jgi:tRNA pseudouridine55 synthase
MRPRADARPIDGVLLLDKAAGITSNRALQQIKRLYRAQKAGHVGTLDPLATGLLPVCLGEATKFAGTLLESDKAYRTIIKLGERTDTADAEGQVIETRAVSVRRDQLDAILARFRGAIEQIPPMYSAIKLSGKPMYEFARQGQTIERKPRSIQIHSLKIIGFDAPMLELDIICSKGTYIRSLAEDIGMALGCGGHVWALRRTAVGSFGIDQAVTMATLENQPETDRDVFLRPLDTLLDAWLKVRLPLDPSRRFQMGMGIAIPEHAWAPGTQAAVYAETGGFLGLGEIAAGGLLQPRRLLRNS